MPSSDHSAADRIKSTLFLLLLVCVVAFFALHAIPKAARPALHQPVTVPATQPATP